MQVCPLHLLQGLLKLGIDRVCLLSRLLTVSLELLYMLKHGVTLTLCIFLAQLEAVLHAAGTVHKGDHLGELFPCILTLLKKVSL